MLSLPNDASIEAALAQPLDCDLRDILQSHFDQARSAALVDETHILVVQPGDTEETILDEIRFSPLINPVDGSRCGQPDFHPFWDWLQERGGWHQMIVTVGDTGFAFILLIPKADGVLPDLLQLCAAYAEGRS